MKFNILRYEQLDSTNSEAARQSRQGAAEGTCVIALEQTDGRGRLGRKWISEKDAGLYFSVVLRPRIERQYLALITLMAGVAVHDTLAEFGLKPDIKWVNDVLIGEKKISGILSEAIDTPTGPAVIVGIGINLMSRGFPDEIAKTSTSVEAEVNRRIETDDLSQVLTRYLFHFYGILCEADGPAKIVQHWRQRSSYHNGKHVCVNIGSELVEGVTDGIEEHGALRVKTADGSVRIFQAGDVQRLRAT